MGGGYHSRSPEEFKNFWKKIENDPVTAVNFQGFV